MSSNIFAYTAPGCNYPEYISINIQDGQITVTARGVAQNGECGQTVCVPMSAAEVRKMASTLFGYACTGNA
jgi:hypothetical protein